MRTRAPGEPERFPLSRAPEELLSFSVMPADHRYSASFNPQKLSDPDKSLSQYISRSGRDTLKTATPCNLK